MVSITASLHRSVPGQAVILTISFLSAPEQDAGEDRPLLARPLHGIGAWLGGDL